MVLIGLLPGVAGLLSGAVDISLLQLIELGDCNLGGYDR